MGDLTRKYLLKEWSEDEDPLQDMADLVGKGGKHENKEVAAYLKKTYGVVKEKQKTIQQVMDMLEDHNFHTENAILQAVKSKKSAIKPLIALGVQHNKSGGLDYDLSMLRSYLSNPKWFLDFHGKRDNSKTRITKSTMKIVDSLPPKQKKEFLSVFSSE